ncbi:phloretin 4'-O-glucosyltransferase-like [Gastrolobium bilobum]|uniref:phloretin 4'-O-glucosyltransferase-like n=1 Tax=Gastrolobium bilobum TaxID=150636 RepID=UPI002AB1A9FE|nr:phloretin 4'-O-glucosyltransferase-like [Gastrolobium bilobum]
MVHHRFLLVAYPVQGHINPALEFAKRLIAFGAHVTLVVTLHMYRRMTNKVNIPALSLVAFSDGYDAGFSITADGNGDYSVYASELKRRGTEFVPYLILSSAQEGHPFTCLVYTLLLNWAAEVARGFHLPTALLWVQTATVFDIFYYYFHGYGDYINNKIKEPSSSIELPGLPSFLAPRDLPSHLLDSCFDFHYVFFPMYEAQFNELDVETNPRPRVLVNTFEALEPEVLRAVDNINMIPIGPLIPSAFLDGKDANDTSFGGDIFHSSNGYIEWLDSKAVSSVIYVSFGSFCVLSKIQMEEIARALLDCGHPFLWVIREKEKNGKEMEELSCKEELEEKGKIVKWCSQVKVLSHASLGCFVTHCGWNSTMESLVSGVPVVAFPQCSDQKTNANMIEDVWKTGVRVNHEVNEDGVVQAEEIRTCLEVVMGNGEKGNELRGNAKKWKVLARDASEEGGPSETNLKTFLNDVA